MASRQSALTAAVVTLLGATLGGLLLWRQRAIRTKKQQLSAQGLKGQVRVSSCPLPVEPEPVVLDCKNPVESQIQSKQTQLSPGQSLVLPLPAVLPPVDQALAVQPVMVSSEKEWEQLWPMLQKDLSVYPVLGLDCEWVKSQTNTLGVSVKDKTSTVSLLQMASYSGLCVLVRLQPFRAGQQDLPLTLKEVLSDPHILKVGVGCYEDGKRLTRDYGLALGCTVDLRYLALRQRKVVLNNGLSLKSLAADLLNVSLEKSLELRCSDWEADPLTLQQMTYAARDAQVSIALFFRLLGLHSDTTPSLDTGSGYSQLANCCQGVVDTPFRGWVGGECEDGGKSVDRERRRRSRKLQQSVFESQESGDQQVPDPRKNNKRKSLGVGYSARKSPLYDNCFLHAPDGQPLCTCDKKKAKWYLDKGIGVLQSEDPFIVRLLFEPSGRPDSQQDYYLTAKENLCVVCGKNDSYIRKNIVPHEYRRHFPTEMKDHNSHDILLLCTSCHAASNVHDGFLKQQLADEHAAPQGCEEGVRLLEDSDRRRVRSAARALLTAGEGLPGPRRDELQEVIRSFFNDLDGELTTDTLQSAAGLETRIFNESYVPHGLKVVQAHAKQGLKGLMGLERHWRQHFLSTMTPRYLPPLWSVNHNHSKFLRKYGEDLPIQLN
ncbi:exonuclease 3'-5' domain-containing protein 2 isoform X2 [Oncorhynchus mykiss]|uniref:Exonuclease 3'-5' domain-containing protein 2 n=1 Tax=Oncorhynchus mykiss TaxID=8022 RepID=A0A8K9XP35_ONCMY|nr:exonuclease 3'-5' domain-containing protein 2 isoform X1 [Oncorhynchus mykiss]XP_036818330.1 exonuclease 3'-5' domain-containing protein 2 isoform X2 [Oncorhynchus mykiss]